MESSKASTASINLSPAINSSANNSSVKLCLFLSLLLIGTGIFYPSILAYRQQAQIESLLLAEEFLKAESLVDKALARNPNDARNAYFKAVLARRKGEPQVYAQWRERSLKAGADKADLELQDALLAVQQGEIDRQQEQQLVARAQATNSDVVASETFEAIARGYLSTYRLKEAWQCLEFWSQWRNQSVEARLMRGEIYVRTGMPALAVKEFQEILKTAPEHALATQRLANTLLKLNEVEVALGHLERLCARPDVKASARIDLAEAQRRTGDLDAATQSVEAALKLGVDTRERGQCSSVLGQMALAQQQPERAIELLLVAVELIPEDATAHHALGSALTLTGKSELGEKHRKLAQKIRQDYEQVQNWTRKVIDTPSDPELRVNIGRALMDQGMRSEGIAWIKTALACDPAYEPARQLLTELKIADAKRKP